MRILCLEDDPNAAELLTAMLQDQGCPCALDRVETRVAFEQALKGGQRYDLILADYSLPSFNGMAALAIARELTPELPFIFVSGSLGEEVAIESLRNGATDYLLKGNLSRLSAVIERALNDVKERKIHLDAVASLRESEERFRLLVENSNDLVAEIDLDARAVYVSPNHEKLLGHRPEALVGRQLLELVHPADRANAVEQLAKDVATAAYRFQHADGSWRWLESNGRRFNTSGGLTRAVVVSRDITDRRQTEHRLAEQARLLDLATDAIVVRDLDDRVRYWNHGAEQVFQWTAAEAVGKSVMELVRPQKETFAEAGALLRRDGRWSGEIRVHRKDGKELIISQRLTLVENNEDGVTTILAIGTDVTEKKNLESQYLRAQRLEGIGLLASGIAHDLNNILAPILMAAPLIRSEVVAPESLELLRTIETSALRGADMVKQILTFTRGVGEGTSTVDVRLLLNELVRLARETFPRSINVQTTLPPSLWPVTGDPTQLHQVFLNLFINARDAMPKGGKLAVVGENVMLGADGSPATDGEQLASYTRIAISDSGEGIPESIRERIFEPFFTTKEAGKGTGLGLASVRNIVGSHGGFLRLHSTVGEGTCFEIFLPTASRMDSQPAAPAAGGSRNGHRGRGELILVVDDEVQIREVSRRILEMNGYRVETASDGVEAIAAFARNRDSVKVLITDTDMPKMDGKSLIRVLLKMRPDLRVIASGGQLSPADRDAFRNLSVEQFLDKPYPPERLLSAAHDVIHHLPPGSETTP